MENCRICAAETRLFDTATVLGKYEASYYQCTACDFIQVADPHWLAEAYSSAITSTDLGYVGRNLATALITKACISCHFSGSTTYVDYGGGYGLLVRLLRDLGYDFYLWDKYCQNIFANGFEATPGARYDLLTSFEVFEHLLDPIQEVEKMLKLSGSILFSTTVPPTPAPKIKDWWYYSPHHGQHIAFYSVKSLQALARRFNLKLVTNREKFHVLTPSKISPFLFNLTSRQKTSVVLDKFIRRKSLLDADCERLMKSAAQKA
jgi:hypothetical protein